MTPHSNDKPGTVESVRSLTVETIRALLRGQRLDEPVNYEAYGEYHDLVFRLNLMSAIGIEQAERLWAIEALEFPKLSALVDGIQQEGLVHAADLFPVMKEWYDHGAPQGVSPGWPSLAREYRVLPTEMTVITGTPSSGKSRFLTAMLVNIAEHEDWKFLIFSPEMSPPQRHLELVLTQCLGKPFRLGKPGRMTWAEAEEGLQWIHKHFTWLWPKTQPATIPYLLQMAKYQALTTDIKGVVIDPWNRVSHKRGDKELDTAYIGECLGQLSAAAQTYGYHQFVVAHPTKVFKDGGKFPVVTPNLIAGSANWWNMPENILSVRRDLENDENNTTEIYIQKIRWDENGRMGRRVDLHYHPETARYSELYSSPYASNGRYK